MNGMSMKLVMIFFNDISTFQTDPCKTKNNISAMMQAVVN